MTNPIEIMARAMHGELSRIDVMRYLDMPNDTAERVATAALSALTDAGFVLCEGEPVGYLLAHPEWPSEYDQLPLLDGDKAEGWTETPLYRAKGPSDEPR